MKSLQRLIITTLAAALILTTAGCVELFQLLNPINGLPRLGTGSSKLQRFDSPEQLLDFFKIQAQQRLQSNRRFGGILQFDALAGAAPEATNDAAAGDGASGEDFTSTNLQENNVDEADVFKSDGQYFYIARGQTLEIIDVRNPASPVAGGSLALDEGIRAIYLRGDRVLVLAPTFRDFEWNIDIATSMIYPPYYQGSDLVLYDVDVSDRGNPTITRRIELDGNLVTSRLTGDRLVLVLSIVPELPTTLPEILALELDDILPVALIDGAERDLVDWADYYRPGRPDGVYMTAVVALDADDLTSEVSSTAIVGEASTVYSSTEALYVSDAEYDPNDNYRETTTLHKFRYDENGAANYVATGSVPGRLLNQFSLGEHERRLNLATHIPAQFSPILIDEPFGGVGIAVADAPVATAQNFDSSVARNAVFTLVENGDTLDVAGSVDGIAPGERLYSARFMGERGFLVTFRQIDPFFTVDLSEADNPRIRGELKIPGYSDYLHPFGDNLVIGVGRAVQINQFGGAVPTSVQLSLFDVSDLDDPTLVQQIQVGGQGSYADVSYDTKAFAFLASEGLLGLPVYLNDGFAFEFEAADFARFDGILAYRVTESGFEALGQMPNVVSGDFGFRNWCRAAFIGQQVYAISDFGVTTADVSAMDQSVSVRID